MTGKWRFASGTSYLTYTFTRQGFFFSFVASLSLVPRRSFDRGREIKTEQVPVEVEINCGEKKKYAQVSKQRMR